MRQGDSDLVARLRELSPPLLAYFRRRVQPEEDAADLLAETMLTAWRRRAAVPASAEETRMWLYGVAHNVLRNWYRGQRRQRSLAEKLREQLVRECAAPDLDVVGDAIGRLPPDQAEIIRLVHWEGFTLVEAALVVNVRESTARGRYQRARQNLQRDPDIERLHGNASPVKDRKQEQRR